MMLIVLLQTPIPIPTPVNTPTSIPASDVFNRFLENPQWGGIGGILAIAALILTVVGLVFTWRQLQRKRLMYEIISDTNLSLKKFSGIQNLKFLHGTKDIYHLRTLTLEFANRGNSSIRIEDYDPVSPLTLEFDAKGIILKAEVVSAQTDSLKIAIQPTVQNNKVIFPIRVINRRGWFRVEIVLADDESPVPKPTAIIADVDEIQLGQNIREAAIKLKDIVFLTFIGVLTDIAIQVLAPNDPKDGIALFVLVCMTILVVLLFISPRLRRWML